MDDPCSTGSHELKLGEKYRSLDKVVLCGEVTDIHPSRDSIRSVGSTHPYN
jgi:hypothetical protein